MCDIKVFETASNSGDLDSVCLTSGKQITETCKYGMFCEDFCDLDKAKEFYAFFHDVAQVITMELDEELKCT